MRRILAVEFADDALRFLRLVIQAAYCHDRYGEHQEQQHQDGLENHAAR